MMNKHYDRKRKLPLRYKISNQLIVTRNNFSNAVWWTVLNCMLVVDRKADYFKTDVFRFRPMMTGIWNNKVINAWEYLKEATLLPEGQEPIKVFRRLARPEDGLLEFQFTAQFLDFVEINRENPASYTEINFDTLVGMLHTLNSFFQFHLIVCMHMDNGQDTFIMPTDMFRWCMGGPYDINDYFAGDSLWRAKWANHDTWGKYERLSRLTLKRQSLRFDPEHKKNVTHLQFTVIDKSQDYLPEEEDDDSGLPPARYTDQQKLRMRKTLGQLSNTAFMLLAAAVLSGQKTYDCKKITFSTPDDPLDLILSETTLQNFLSRYCKQGLKKITRKDLEEYAEELARVLLPYTGRVSLLKKYGFLEDNHNNRALRVIFNEEAQMLLDFFRRVMSAGLPQDRKRFSTANHQLLYSHCVQNEPQGCRERSVEELANFAGLKRYTLANTKLEAIFNDWSNRRVVYQWLYKRWELHSDNWVLDKQVDYSQVGAHLRTNPAALEHTPASFRKGFLSYLRILTVKAGIIWHPAMRRISESRSITDIFRFSQLVKHFNEIGTATFKKPAAYLYSIWKSGKYMDLYKELIPSNYQV